MLCSLTALSFALLAGSSFGQGTAEDYARADALRQRFANNVFRDKVDPHWFDGGDRFWYRVATAANTWEFVLVDAVKGTRLPAFDHERLAKSLAGAWNERVDADRLPIRELVLDTEANVMYLVTGRGTWRCNLETYAIEKAERPQTAKPEQRPQRERRPDRARLRGGRSPDGKWEAFVREHDVHLRERATGDVTRLTDDGTDEHFYEGRFHWSPDSTRFITVRTRPEQRHTVHFVESSPRDQVQPKLHSHQYLKPGDRIRQSKPHLFDATRPREIPVADDLFENPWSIGEYRWALDGSRFTFLYNQRGHRVLRIVAVDAATGEATSLVEDAPETFVDYAFKKYTRYLDETGEILWMSERSGWNHLYLFDAATGELKNAVTAGEWVVRKVERVDDEARQVWFTASGIHPDQDPYHLHHCRVDFDGENLVVLTDGDGTHDVRPSPDGRFLLDRYSRVDLPPVTELRRVSDGQLVVELERADVTALEEAGWQPPERFVAKARDDTTDIWGIIHRPTNFDPERRYPVIEKIYAGPHGSFVPKSFRPYHSAQHIAELGFVVVQIDGMGTSNRSKAFHDVCWRNLGDSGFPDRIRWIRAAAEKHPSLDLERVGIYGGSAGGQSSTRAMLAHGDFYKVAVSDCGCHDNRMDKIWWNELWMSWPVGPHYAEQSNVTNAHRLTGKLLLIVGELDRNVDPASTMQVVDALIRADKDFDLLVVPGGGHGIAESRYGKRRRRDYFVRNLWNVEPRR